MLMQGSQVNGLTVVDLRGPAQLNNRGNMLVKGGVGDFPTIEFGPTANPPIAPLIDNFGFESSGTYSAFDTE